MSSARMRMTFGFPLKGWLTIPDSPCVLPSMQRPAAPATTLPIPIADLFRNSLLVSTSLSVPFCDMENLRSSYAGFTAPYLACTISMAFKLPQNLLYSYCIIHRILPVKNSLPQFLDSIPVILDIVKILALSRIIVQIE